MQSPCLLLLGSILVLCACCGHVCEATGFTFRKGPIPSWFRRGQHYPNRPEEQECQPIRLHIERNSRRYRDLVRYSASNVRFSNSDSRLMSSRLHSRLNTLANWFRNYYGYRLLVLKAWTPYPDTSLNNGSLHYEGRTIQIRVPSQYVASKLLRWAAQAKFDWVFYATSSYVRVSVIPDVCDANVDIVFMQDQSGSVKKHNHDKSLQFISNVVDFFMVGRNATQVGMITYSSNARVEFDLNDLDTKSEIQDHISRIRYPSGYTSTALALLQAGVILNPLNGRGARPSSEGIPKIAVLITDGRSNGLPVNRVAMDLQDFGVQVYTVGIANYFLPELKLIASDPDRLHIFLLDSFNDAQGFVDFLSFTTCNTPAIVAPGENTTTEVPEDGFRFFQTECLAFSLTILIEQVDIRGRCNLYASNYINNPGPLDNSTVVVRNETAVAGSRSVILRFKKGFKKVIYIGVQGKLLKNLFTVIIWDRVFNEESYTTMVIEGVADRFVFDLNSEVSIPNTRFIYRIKEGNTNDDFRIDQTNGHVLTNNSLSVQRTPVYWLRIVAENANASCHRGRVNLKVIVVPNQINIGNLPSASVPENATTGTEVTQVQVMGTVGVISYSIQGGNAGNAFQIDSMTGRITVVASSLDFETLSMYRLVIRAAIGNGGASDTAIQVINVTDVNERPFFTLPCAGTNSCVFSVDENRPTGSPVGTIGADDPDLSTLSNGMLTFTIDNSNFVIDNAGNIRTNAVFDREMRDTYTANVVVRDQGNPSLSAETQVTIHVNDLNDNPPFFTLAPTPIQVFENFPNDTTIAEYAAEDNDTGVNAEIMFSLQSSVPNLPFYINSRTGILSTFNTLDFEAVQQYNITVVASNPDGLSTSVDIMVVILDVNDNSPVFDQSPYRASVLEHSAENTFVVQVNATDADSEGNGRVGYQIINGNFNNSFRINSDSGEIRVANDIDREQVSMFTLTVEAFDSGLIRMRSSVSVLIDVEDINDNAPIFDPDLYNIVVPETEPLQSVLDTVMATDLDQPGNPNSEIVFSITSGNEAGKFAINATSGGIILVQSLDFEVESRYTLQLRAEDRGNPVMFDTAVVMITVLNINEHPPVISNDRTVNISELALVGTEIAQFNASDIDQMSITFSFADNTNPDGIFAISSTGLVTLNRSLDFEQQQQHVLDIVATDGTLSDTAVLTVNVINENEFAPEFVGPTSFSVLEEQPSNTLVGTVRATDADDSDTVTYSIQSGPLSSFFQIDSDTGAITTTMSLDREMLVEENRFLPPNSQEQITVVARDSIPTTRQTSVQVAITLLDINDNSPVFQQDDYSVNVTENRAAGQVVFTAQATDADIGQNGEIRYSIITENVPFAINSATGEVTTTARLDREDRSSYTFTILARDLGTPSRNDTAEALVIVLDENDNDPIFTLPVYSVDVPENIPVNQPIVQVIANDDDIGENSRITYAIVGSAMCTTTNPPPSQCFFNINPGNGLITIRQLLDFETTQQHNFTVLAMDNGAVRRSARAQVVVNVINVDEAAPEFDGPCDANFLETDSLMQVVTTCSATDSDTGRTTNPSLTYTILTGNIGNTFSIDSNGTIRNIQPVDREERNEYSLTVEVEDRAGLSTTQTVRITIGDVNDNRPEFVGAPFSAQLTSTQIVNRVTQLLTLQVTDADEGANAEIDFTIAGVQAVTADTVNSTVVAVTATDRGSPSMSSTTNVSVSFGANCAEFQFSVNNNGTLNVEVFCNVNIQGPTIAVFGEELVLQCNVLVNIEATVRFLHNESIITSPEIVLVGESGVELRIANVTFQNAGRYACLAGTGSLSSLQSNELTVEVNVAPRIVVPPINATIGIGEAITFLCVANGIPAPSIDWLRDSAVLATGNPRILPSGNLLQITNAQVSDTNDYLCRATNPAGSDEATARLVIFELVELVLVTVTNIADPVPTTMCNNFDSQGFQNTMSTITGQSARTGSLNGTDVCSSGPCNPNPCSNGGTCNATGPGSQTFECMCPPGYIGDRCEEDVDECEGMVCLNGGTCTNINGGFMCTCPPDYTGQLCEFSDCNCPAGSQCVVVEGEKMCSAISRDGSVTITTSNVAVINNHANTITENADDQNSSSRKRRQTPGDNNGVSVCRAHLVPSETEPNKHTLLWVCPEGVDPPSDSALEQFCREIVNTRVAVDCSTSNERITFPVIPASRIDVGFIIIDPTTNRPMQAGQALTLLKDTNALEKLRANGFTAGEFRAAVDIPETESVSGSSMVGGVVGGIFAVLGVVVIIAVIILAVILYRRRRPRHPYIPPKATVSTSNDGTLENHYAEYNPMFNNPVHSLNSDYSLVSSIPDEDLTPKHREALFDDPIYSQPQKPKKTPSRKGSTLRYHKRLQHTGSTENLLDEDSGEYDQVKVPELPPRPAARPIIRVQHEDSNEEGGEEELYANMNFTGQGNAGQRWEDYQKTATLLKGVDPPKKR